MNQSELVVETVDDLAGSLVDWPGGREHALASLAETIAQHLGHSLQGRGYALIDRQVVSDAEPQLSLVDHVSPDLMVPATLGQVFEQLMGADERRKGGSHFTPPLVAAGLVEAATTGWEIPVRCQVLDPSSGGGAFLLAAANWLSATLGLNRRGAAALVFGRDLDPTAVAISELTMALWCLEAGEEPVPGGCELADGLLDPMPVVDLIVGNPPFLNQLGASTVRNKAQGQAVSERFGQLGGPYADTAAFFIPAGLEALRPGGRMVLIQPQSLLASRDVEKIRRLVTTDHSLVGVWFCAEPVFAASVRVCAPVISQDANPDGAEIQRWSGVEITPADPIARPTASRSGLASWGPLMADLVGIPSVALVRSEQTATIGSLASATAGFRDEFYGFAPHTRELANIADVAGPNARWPAAVTVGMIDALRLRWGTGEFRYAGERWVQPVVDTAAVASGNESLQRWMLDRLRPKLVMATQTKAIEVVVDEAGELVPITPVIAIEPNEADPETLWLLAAALSAPPISAMSLAERLGSALSVRALKLAAADVMALPLPSDPSAWSAGAELARSAHHSDSALDWGETMVELGQTMCAAYGVETPGLNEWWFDRLPGYR